MVLEETPSKLNIVRHQKLENGKEVDDYLDITYYPNEKNMWDTERITIRTNMFKRFVEALNVKITELGIE